MKRFTGKEIFPFIHGVLSCSVNENGLVVLNRFTEAQRRRYAETGAQKNIAFIDRADASSGVTLEMDTDSSFIAFTPVMKPSCRTFAAFDCYVDGVLHGHWFQEDITQVPVSFDLPEGMHRVQIFFPWSVIVMLDDVVVEQGASVQPVSKDGRFLVFGDSITQGYVTVHPSCGYVNLLGLELEKESVNQAVGGYWFDADTLDASLKDCDPDFLLVAYGTNDYSLMTSPESFTENCRAFTARLVELFPDKKILGILPIYRNDLKHIARSRMRDFKPEDGIRTIREIYEKYPNITILEDHFFPRHGDFLAPDLLHPNDLGNMFYANAVTRAVKTMLQA